MSVGSVQARDYGNTTYISKTDQKLVDRMKAMGISLSSDSDAGAGQKILNFLNTGSSDTYTIGQTTTEKIGSEAVTLGHWDEAWDYAGWRIVGNKEIAQDKDKANKYGRFADSAVRDVLNTPEMQAMADLLATQYAAAKGGTAVDYRGDVLDSLYGQVAQLTKQMFVENTGALESDINRAAALALIKMKERMAKIVDAYDKAKAEGDNPMDAAEKATTEELVRLGRLSGCSTIMELRDKYQGGCWSCLVVEKMVSTFLTVASQAYPLSQNVGLIVLGIGSVMWILMWGLKNLSSLTQLDVGNILNDLLKFLFKVLLAYVFIMAGLKAVGTYIINPVMSTGSVIAQNFWSKGLGDSYEAYITEDYNYDEIDQAYEKAKDNQDKYLTGDKSAEGQEDDLRVKIADQQAKMLADAQKKALSSYPANGSNIQIPGFQMPGTAGTFVSPFGCRPAPVTQGNSKGSTIHKGVDIAASSGNPIYAIGPGRITYSYSKSGGYTATILHDADGQKWTSIYMHMLPRSSEFAVNYNRQANPLGTRSNWVRVAQGQQLGFVGNTGNSGGNHLHLAIKYKGDLVDPLSLMNKKVVFAPRNCPVPTTEANRTPTPENFKRDQTKFSQNGVVIGGEGAVDLSGMFVTESQVSGMATFAKAPKIGDVIYGGPTDILSRGVMNSILGATKAITDTVAENMVLGDAIQCYAGQEKGGAWKFGENFLSLEGKPLFHITNAIMWIQGILIWCTGFLLTLAVAYYLIDICFKVGFAVIALPIVVGLWPFNMTKSKFSACLSIIFKASATFAFLAITTSYAMNLISAGLEGKAIDDPISIGATTDLSSQSGGLERIYQALDETTALERSNSGGNNEANIQYIADRLAVFSADFIILIFCFLYSYKLIGGTISQLVNKFFPDNVFGNASPMHNWSTAATKWVKDQAMKPAGLARDIALHQGGRAIKGAMKAPVHAVAKAFGKKGTGKDKSDEQDNKDSKE